MAYLYSSPGGYTGDSGYGGGGYGGGSYGGYSGGAYGSGYSSQPYGGYNTNDQGRRHSLGSYAPGTARSYPSGSTSMNELNNQYEDQDENIVDDWKRQSEEKKRLEQARKERERYEDMMLEQTVMKQQEQMKREFEEEQRMKEIKEEQRRKKQESHRAYLEQLDGAKPGGSGGGSVGNYDQRPTPDSSGSTDSKDIYSRRPSYEADPTSVYSKYNRKPAKGKGAYDLSELDKLGPKSKPIIKKRELGSGDQKSSSASSNPSKSKQSSPKDREQPQRSSSSGENDRRIPRVRILSASNGSKSSPESKTKTPEKENSEPEKTDPDPSPPEEETPKPKTKKPKNKKQEENEFKRRKLPDDDRNFDFGLNLGQASQSTEAARNAPNPFFDSEPGRRRKTPDNRSATHMTSGAPSRFNSYQPPDSRHSTGNSSTRPQQQYRPQRVDTEVQTPGAYNNSVEVQATMEARYRSTQTVSSVVDNGVQTYDEEFEPEKPKTAKPPPTPFDWKITLEDSMSQSRPKKKEQNAEDFGKEHKGFQSQLFALKKGLVADDSDDERSSSSRSRGLDKSSSSLRTPRSNYSRSGSRNGDADDDDDGRNSRNGPSTRDGARSRDGTRDGARSREGTRDGARSRDGNRTRDGQRTRDGPGTSDQRSSRDGRRTSDGRSVTREGRSTSEGRTTRDGIRTSDGRLTSDRNDTRGTLTSRRDVPTSRSQSAPRSSNKSGGLNTPQKNLLSLEDTTIDLEGTDRTVLSQYMSKRSTRLRTGSRANTRAGADEDGYTPSAGERTRQGTPQDEDRPTSRWDEKNNHLLRKETQAELDLDATDRTVLNKYKELHRRP